MAPDQQVAGTVPPLRGSPPANRGGLPQVQVSFDIDAKRSFAAGLGPRIEPPGPVASVSIQGGSNLSEEEISRVALRRPPLKAAEDRRKRSRWIASTVPRPWQSPGTSVRVAGRGLNWGPIWS